MDILPAKGIGSIRLGGSPDEVAAELGTPKTITPLADAPGYPKGRKLVDFGDLSVLTTPDDGIFAITIGCGFGNARLWGRKVFDLTGEELAGLIRDETGLEPTWYGDATDEASIELPELGLIVYLTDGEIDQIELYKAGWRPPRRGEGAN